jgi:hypothetical protein
MTTAVVEPHEVRAIVARSEPDAPVRIGNAPQTPTATTGNRREFANNVSSTHVSIIRLRASDPPIRKWTNPARLTRPNHVERARWGAFLASLSESHGSVVAQAVRRAWSAILAVAPESALPIVESGSDERQVKLTWSTERYRFDVDFTPDGRLEWFFRDRATNEVTGTLDEPERDVPPSAIQYLRKFA